MNTDRMKEVGGDEMLSTPADLTEASVEDAIIRAVKVLSDRTGENAVKLTDYVLTVCQMDKDEALNLTKISYVPIQVVVDQAYSDFEWTLKGICGDETYCIWSPGA